MSTDAAQLRDEIALLERSLADASLEHERGELDDVGLDAITRRDGARLADARARLDALAPAGTETGATPSSAPDGGGDRAAAPRRRPRWLLAVAAASIVVAAGIVGVAAADPFGAAPPAVHVSRSTTVAGLLLNGELLLGEHHPLRALTAFAAALRLDPSNAEALVETGWLGYEFAGLGRHDRAQVDLGYARLRRAVRLHPADAAAHLYYGIVLLQHGRDPAGARQQLVRAASLHESSDEESLTNSFLEYLAAH